jgi:hypothetical protein
MPRTKAINGMDTAMKFLKLFIKELIGSGRKNLKENMLPDK